MIAALARLVAYQTTIGMLTIMQDVDGKFVCVAVVHEPPETAVVIEPDPRALRVRAAHAKRKNARRWQKIKARRAAARTA